MSNLTLIQFFHWYYPQNGKLWNEVMKEAPRLSSIGISHLWLPPAYKGANGGYSVGYDPYDLYDLGEFDQKGTIATKYGTKQEYLQAVETAHKNNLSIIADIVLNHKAGADELEKFSVLKVNPHNRKEVISDRFEIEAWTKFTFPGRKGKYSQFIWDHKCFTGIDWAHDIKENGIFSILNEYGDGWEELTEEELGNYDYLMYADIEFRNNSVREELKRWGEWYLRTTNVDGFRLDAVKHIAPHFIKEWVGHLKSVSKKPLFFVAEYWNIHTVLALKKYIDATEGCIQLFDAPLVHNFHVASKMGRDYDLRNIFNNTLMREFPSLAVTIVQNHDTQPLQALENSVEDWFMPLAHAMILLREQGIPCLFYPALYGAKYTDKGHDGNDYEITISKVQNIEKLILARKLLAYGIQKDYLDHHNTIGWTRQGNDEYPDACCAVLLSNGEPGYKMMEIGRKHKGKTFVDLLGNCKKKVVINKDGIAEFHCEGGSVSVWVPLKTLSKFKSKV